MKFLKISCKQHAELASFCQDRSLSLWEKLAYRFHKYLCPPCAEVRNQFEIIRKVCRSEEFGCDGQDDCVLPDDVRKRMKTNLEKLAR